MRENVIIRFNDHQELNGVREFSIEIAVPGRYEKTVIGASQVEMAPHILDAFGDICDLLQIPQTIEQPELASLVAPIETVEKFTDSQGNPVPVSGFAATAKARFEAQVIRDGKVVEDEAPVVEDK